MVLASQRQDLANTVLAQNNRTEAHALYERALDAYRTVLGDRHPVVADVRFDMAMLDIARGRNLQARATLDEVVQIHIETLGDMHPHVGRALLELADLDRQDGLLRRALERANQGLRIYQDAYPPGHQKLAFAHTRLATIAYRRGDYDVALAAYEATLAIEIRQHGETSDAAAMTRLNIAETLVMLAEFEQALDKLSTAWPVLVRDIPKSPALEGFAFGIRGRALLGNTQYNAARIALERAESAFQKIGNAMAVERADVYWALSRTLDALGQGATERARALALDALAIYEAQGSEIVSPKLDIQRRLGRTSGTN